MCKKLKYSFFVLVAIVFGGRNVCAQQVEQDLYQPPLDIPLAISGNFGELRPNTFHGGIDFKTEALVGLNVYAVEDGYVARIKVDLNGFGRALYINHPNGKTSVYGHLEAFRDDIAKYCKAEQYKLKQFWVDLSLKPNEIKVKKGDVIAYAGNRGASSGPHMHFEVRDSKSEHTLDVFKVTNIRIPDTVPPIIEKVWFYPLSDESRLNNNILPQSFNVTSKDGISVITLEVPTIADGEIGFGIQTYDMSSNSLNKIGVYSIDLFVNDSLVFRQVHDEVSFYEMRYVNSLIDYEQYAKTGVRINRLFVQPNNQLSVYKKLVNRGIVNFSDTTTKSIKIRVTDDYSNINECTFLVRGVGETPKTIMQKQKKFGLKMSYKIENKFENEKVKLVIPKDALYDDLWFGYSKSQRVPGYFSELYRLHNSTTPLHKSGILSLKADKLPTKFNRKALLVSLDPSGKVIWSGGEYKDGFVTGNIRSFGNYTIAVDTVPPIVTPLFTNVDKNDFTNWAGIAFTAKDDLSGITNYRAIIDGQWALFEYDPKLELLYYKFDPDRIRFGEKHKLDLIVYDDRGNRTQYQMEFVK